MTETRGSRGYILPPIIDPNELMCLKVYIPKDDYYLRAFSGAYHRLGTWQSWEKDATTRAAEAARVWKAAIDYTTEHGWIGGCMDSECCAEIVTAINNISINIPPSGGGGCCSVDKNWKMPDGWEDSLPVDLPPIPDTPTVVPQSELCDQAHMTWSKIREIFDKFAEMTEELQPYDELLSFFIGVGILLLPPPALLLTLLTLGAGALYALLESHTLSFWDQMKDDFICAIVGHDNAASFYAWLRQYVIDNAPNIFVREWMLAVLQMPDWGLLYDGAFDIEPEFVGSLCDCSPPLEWEVYLPETLLGAASTYTLSGATGTGFRLIGTLHPGTSTDTRIVLRIPSLAMTQMQRVTFDLTATISNQVVDEKWGNPGAASLMVNGSFSGTCIIHDGTHAAAGYTLEKIMPHSSNTPYFWVGEFTFPALTFDVDVLLTNFQYLAA